MGRRTRIRETEPASVLVFERSAVHVLEATAVLAVLDLHSEVRHRVLVQSLALGKSAGQTGGASQTLGAATALEIVVLRPVNPDLILHCRYQPLLHLIAHYPPVA